MYRSSSSLKLFRFSSFMIETMQRPDILRFEVNSNLCKRSLKKKTCLCASFHPLSRERESESRVERFHTDDIHYTKICVVSLIGRILARSVTSLLAQVSTNQRKYTGFGLRSATSAVGIFLLEFQRSRSLAIFK